MLYKVYETIIDPIAQPSCKHRRIYRTHDKNDAYDYAYSQAQKFYEENSPSYYCIVATQNGWIVYENRGYEIVIFYVVMEGEDEEKQDAA